MNGVVARDSAGPIVIRRLMKSFGATPVLHGIDLTIEAGSIVCVMGKSGGGKSTLLRCLNLLERPTAGSIAIGAHVIFEDGLRLAARDIVELRRRVGMIFQSFHLFPHLTAAENVILAQTVANGVGQQEALERTIELLGMVGLTHRMLAYPSRCRAVSSSVPRSRARSPSARPCCSATSRHRRSIRSRRETSSLSCAAWRIRV